MFIHVSAFAKNFAEIWQTGIKLTLLKVFATC